MRPGQKPPRSSPSLNGIRLGDGSPLLDGERKIRQAPEFSVQAGLVELLLGPIGKGDRIPGNGLTGRFPELLLLHAIPNGAYASSKTAAAKRKREGQLRGMPDLMLPTARGGYHGLYIEAKRKDETARKQQMAIHRALRAEGYAVAEFDSVQAGLDIVLAYLAMHRSHEYPNSTAVLAFAKLTGAIDTSALHHD